ncbi:DoxX family protein [Rugosimonospora africana]|uniref:DoxX-like protein n=1 Tax=Rugosimonospora africana TaxID=556532 RepID=A0A8J3QUL7_9ACTN|nr:DoxX family protein [Rugosimonospora africana]GIH17103.1 hypothetical protein Raf01_52750 [Rugosimonospora africana]
MFIAYVVVGSVLALAVLASGYGKLSRKKEIVDGLTGIGVPLGMFPFLATCEIAGGLGLLIGIWYAPLGIAAAIGVVVFFIGAVGAHLRKSDFKNLPSPLVLLLLAVAALTLRALSL